MDILKAFKILNEEHNINIQGTIDDPLFQANQIGRILGISNVRESIHEFDIDEKVVSLTDTIRGPKILPF